MWSLSGTEGGDLRVARMNSIDGMRGNRAAKKESVKRMVVYRECLENESAVSGAWSSAFSDRRGVLSFRSWRGLFGS